MTDGRRYAEELRAIQRQPEGGHGRWFALRVEWWFQRDMMGRSVWPALRESSKAWRAGRSMGRPDPAACERLLDTLKSFHSDDWKLGAGSHQMTTHGAQRDISDALSHQEETGWHPGDPCAACGSTDTYGYAGCAGCRSCNAHDADET
jgi:hypothetical protein